MCILDNFWTKCVGCEVRRCCSEIGFGPLRYRNLERLICAYRHQSYLFWDVLESKFSMHGSLRAKASFASLVGAILSFVRFENTASMPYIKTSSSKRSFGQPRFLQHAIRQKGLHITRHGVLCHLVPFHANEDECYTSRASCVTNSSTYLCQDRVFFSGCWYYDIVSQFSGSNSTYSHRRDRLTLADWSRLHLRIQRVAL